MTTRIRRLGVVLAGAKAPGVSTAKLEAAMAATRPSGAPPSGGPAPSSS